LIWERGFSFRASSIGLTRFSEGMDIGRTVIKSRAWRRMKMKGHRKIIAEGSDASARNSITR
jgi:hypothetical protein